MGSNDVLIACIGIIGELFSTAIAWPCAEWKRQIIGIQCHVRNNLTNIRTKALAEVQQQCIGLSSYDQSSKLKKEYTDNQKVTKTIYSHIKHHEKTTLPYFIILKPLLDFFIHNAFRKE